MGVFTLATREASNDDALRAASNEVCPKATRRTRNVMGMKGVGHPTTTSQKKPSHHKALKDLILFKRHKKC